MKSNAPNTQGNIEISVTPDDVFGAAVFIGGDPEGLRSLAALCLWLAELDQDTVLESSSEMREHIHLRPSVQLSRNSAPTEICRLDAKGTGAFPKYFVPAHEGGKSPRRKS